MEGCIISAVGYHQPRMPKNGVCEVVNITQTKYMKKHKAQSTSFLKLTILPFLILIGFTLGCESNMKTMDLEVSKIPAEYKYLEQYGLSEFQEIELETYEDGKFKRILTLKSNERFNPKAFRIKMDSEESHFVLVSKTHDAPSKVESNSLINSAIIIKDDDSFSQKNIIEFDSHFILNDENEIVEGDLSFSNPDKSLNLQYLYNGSEFVISPTASKLDNPDSYPSIQGCWGDCFTNTFNEIAGGGDGALNQMACVLSGFICPAAIAIGCGIYCLVS